MAAIDHEIIWFFNGQPQTQASGETCLKVIDKNTIQLDYSEYGIKLLNGCKIHVSRDCELYEIEPSADSANSYEPLCLQDCCRTIKKGFKKQYVNEEDKEILFLTPYNLEWTSYYEERYNNTLRQKILHFICPVQRKPLYKETIYYYYDVNTFVLVRKNEGHENIIYICDLQNNYSIVGIGGYGHHCNPYTHFMSRGYGEAFEKALGYECYEYLMNDVFFESMENILDHEARTEKPLNKYTQKTGLGLSLINSIVFANGEYTYYSVREGINKWMNKFSYIYRWSEQSQEAGHIPIVSNNQVIVNSMTFSDFNGTGGVWDVDPEKIQQLPDDAQIIIEDEEENYYKSQLQCIPMKEHSDFIYSKDTLLDKWNKFVEQRTINNNKEG